MHKYDIAISFAGEDRDVAAQIAAGLVTAGVKVFYDDFEKADLWGKDLYEYLADIYANHARFCIMLLSQNYERKLWTNHERKNAQVRAFQEKEEYILPVKLDDTQIPGIRPTIGYIDLRTTAVDELIKMVLVKLNRAAPTVLKSVSNPTVVAADLNIPIPKIKKSFTQLEIDRFAKAGFAFIMSYFKQGTGKISKADDALEGDFTESGPLKFVVKIYHHGSVISQCKIWLGGMFSSGQICYSENFYDADNDSSMNDWLSVSTDGFTLSFEPSGMGIGFDRFDQKNLNEQQAAEYLWRRFTARLSQ